MAEELDFERAEPSDGEVAPTLQCTSCERTIGTTYYEARGKILCPPCKGQLSAAIEAKGNTLKGLVYGGGGAALGALIYFGVAALTGYEIGLIAILVGWLVGRGVAVGSGGVGGRRYQVMAVALTYLSVSVSYAGLVVREVASNPATLDSLTTADTPALPAALGDSAVSQAGPGEANGPTLATTAADDSVALTAATVGTAFGALFLGILSLPLMVGLGDLPGSLLGLLIVAFGLRQAWQMNSRPDVTITGPFAVGERPSSP